MPINLVHHFHIPTVCYDAGLYTVDQRPVLGILYDSTPADAPEFSQLLSLALFQPETGACIDLITVDNTVAETYVTTDALLRYDPFGKRWIIGSLVNINYIALRTLTSSDEKPVLSPLALLLEDYGETGLYPLLDLATNSDTITLLYAHPDQIVDTAPGIIQLDIHLSSEWVKLQESAAIIQTGTDVSQTPQSWQGWLDRLAQKETKARYVQPDDLAITIHDTTIEKTEAIQIKQRKELAQSDLALALTNQTTRLLVLCSRESWVRPQDHIRSKEERFAHQEWRFWLSGWQLDGTGPDWTYAPDYGIPVSPDTSDHPVWPIAYVAAIPGPLTQQGQRTFVTALALLKPEEGSDEAEEKGEVLGEVICLDQKGEVIQKCSSPIGLKPRLAHCNDTIIGVDRLDGTWRLWNWFTFEHPSFDKILTLDENCQRVFVQAEPDSERVWLIEELAEGVRVSYRDAETLTEISSELVENVQLLEDQSDFRPLDGYRDRGIIPYKDTLLLLVINENEETIMYQVR